MLHPFGFALDLMRKDIGITMDTLTALNIPAWRMRGVGGAPDSGRHAPRFYLPAMGQQLQLPCENNG